MIAITSLSPSHVNKDVQQKAIDSWVNVGMDCYSFNHPSEIDVVSIYDNITVIPTENTMQHIFKKPYVQISAMMKWARRQNQYHYCFINSDIELANDKKLLHKIQFELNDKVVIAHRQDYENSKKESRPYLLGIDAFFLNQKHLDVFPPSLFCLGQCFWDYNIPYTAIKNGVEVLNLQNKFAYHKMHPVQYSVENWEITGKMFAMEHNIPMGNVGRLNELTFNFLQLNTKKVTL